jgi:hypothetical protein
VKVDSPVRGHLDFFERRARNRFDALVYFVISFAASLLVRGLQRRVAIIR